MDVFVAVIRLRPDDDSSARRFHPPQDFELLLDSNSRGHGLPRFRSRPNEHPLDCALRNVRKISKLLGERAIPVPLCVDKPSSSQNTHSKLICLPIIGNNASKLQKISGYRFCNLSHLLNLAIKSDEWLEKESQYLITCLDDWVTRNQQQSVEFMSILFRNRPAIERIRRCTHNPGQNPRLVCFCYRALRTTEVTRKSSELEEAVENSNNTRAYMISKEKYKLYLLNPAFGGVITRRMKEAAPDYYAKGRRTRQRLLSNANLNSWEQMFKLHAACMIDVHMAKKLLDHSYNPNEVDSDSWSPLHYCAFYNKFEACELLMLHIDTKVNLQNKTGSTALHFAALNGHDLLVELMLSHTAIDTSIKDNNGRTALDLCEQVPKPEWMRIAFLLRNTQLRPEKIEIQLVGRSSLQVKCEVSTATAGLLREKVLKLEGLTNPNASRVFAIWISSERLGLQLKADKIVKDPIERWSEHLDKWGDHPLTNQKPEDDIPHLVLRRNAWTLLGDEQALARNCVVAVRLLYAEAENNYLNGMYPCKDKDCIKMSAIILRLLCGAKQSTVDYNLMTKIIPKHMIPPTNDRSYQKLVNKVLEAHSNLPQTNVTQLQFDFLQCCWKQKIYGCTFFKALMYRNKSPHASIEVFVGLNDFGISVINRQTLKQVESMEINGVELEYESGKNYIQVHRRKHDTLVFNTHQAVLINNLFKQIKTKVGAAQVKK